MKGAPTKASLYARSIVAVVAVIVVWEAAATPASCPAVLPAGVQHGDDSALEHHR